MNQELIVAGSPHIQAPLTTRRIMWLVIAALMPACACALYTFGIGALIVIATSVAGCVVAEHIIARWLMKRRSAPLFSASAALTGILLAFNLPSNIPVWIVLIGCVVAIGIGKMAFGGLGCNIFNPALVGRVFLLISFPAQMTTWPLPIVNRLSYTDASTGATLLSQLQSGQLSGSWIDLTGESLGLTAGSLGEVGAAALLLGFLYLLARRIVSWHIPVAIFSAVALFTIAFGGDFLTEILCGGMMLGALFMATDYVTSPMSHRGMLLYGFMIGLITMIIRRWGAYPEGMSFAILIMNGATPLINRFMRPRRFAERRSCNG